MTEERGGQIIHSVNNGRGIYTGDFNKHDSYAGAIDWTAEE